MDGLRLVLYFLITLQAIAWVRLSLKGTKLTYDREFLLFMIFSLLGQLGIGIDAFMSGAWRIGAVQILFFIITVVGIILHYRETRQRKS